MNPAGASPLPMSAWSQSRVVRALPGFDDEHDRVPDHLAWIEFDDRIDNRPPVDRR